MRMSCNGCRVLRKGCSDNCSIRPCLQWIKSPESQANATVFLAKFYGRAGLLNLVNSGPDHLRPAIFRSLLYEACGRVLNPIYGSTGLLWAGNWHICQSAVEAVLQGLPIVPIAADAAVPPLKVYDIRHVSKEEITAKGGDGVRHVRRTCRFKRAKSSASTTMEVNRSNSHESSLVLQSEPQEAESSVAVETADLLSLCRAPLGGRPDVSDGHDEFDIQLELSLGWQSQSSTCGSCQCGAWQHGNSESRNESMGGV